MGREAHLLSFSAAVGRHFCVPIAPEDEVCRNRKEKSTFFYVFFYSFDCSRQKHGAAPLLDSKSSGRLDSIVGVVVSGWSAQVVWGSIG